MDPTPTLGVDLDPDALDASIDRAVDELFVDRTSSRTASQEEPVAPEADASDPACGEMHEDGLLRIKQHLLALDWEISAANIAALRASVGEFGGDSEADEGVRGILSRLEELCDSLETAGPEVRPETVQMLHTTVRSLDRMVRDDAPPQEQQEAAAEVESGSRELAVSGPESGPQDPEPLEAALALEMDTAAGSEAEMVPAAVCPVADAPSPVATDAPGADSEPKTSGISASPVGGGDEDDLPLLEPEEILGAASRTAASGAYPLEAVDESLPLLEPEPAVTAGPASPREERQESQIDEPLDPRSAAELSPSCDPPPSELADEAREMDGCSQEPTQPREVSAEYPSEVWETAASDAATGDSPLICTCGPTGASEPGGLLRAALESSGRLEAELECANQEVGAFFDRILRAAEGKPHLARLASSFANARDTVAQRLAATEEIACDLRAQLAEAAHSAGVLPGPDRPMQGSCPLGGDAREITGAAGQIQEAVAVLQETLASLLSSQVVGAAPRAPFPSAGVASQDSPHL